VVDTKGQYRPLSAWSRWQRRSPLSGEAKVERCEHACARRGTAFLRCNTAGRSLAGNPWQLQGESYLGNLSSRDQPLSIPNLITIARILLVPVVVWAIGSGEMLAAFLLFLAAGVSDAVDGFIAKRFNMTSEIGAYLDPLADKTLIVSIYVALGITEVIPRWLVILVVSRDIMIIGGVMLSWLVGNPVVVKPLLVSKLNTVAQIVFACLVLGALGLGFDASAPEAVLMYLVALLTLLSVAFYVRDWIRHMSDLDGAPGGR
jgi:cardiolipin synthase (CMP-forming)